MSWRTPSGWCAALLLLVLCPVAARSEALPAIRSVIVKLRGEGPHAVHACAEDLSRRGVPLASAAADASDSLDRLQRSLGVRRIRAVFRRPDGSPFQVQRRALQSRLLLARSARGRRAAGPEVDPPDLAHVYRMELSGEVDAFRAAALLGADPHVEYAQPNYWLVPERLLDDPFLHTQGSWRQAYPDQWGIHAIDAPAAWDRTLGEGVVVAVVDTGVEYDHPDLVQNAWVHPGEDLDGDGVAEPEELNGIDDDGNGFVDDLRGYDFHDGDPDPRDENGHGTHVAGIAAARGDNGLGIAGVAPLATLMPVRTFPPFGPAPSDQVWRGVLYAAENGADVINGSFSCGRVCRSNPIAEDVLGAAAQLGVAFVTSAGNLASDVMLKSPERLREAIVVGSLTPSHELADSSSFGLLVDVVAPGQDVLSLKAAAADFFYTPSRFVGGAYMRLSGTSMASPHVAGVLALLLSADPSLTPEQLRLALRLGALDLGEAGHDRRFGAGLVQPAASLALLPPPALRGLILAPLPGDTVETEAAELPIVGSVGGADLESYRLELGEGDAPDHWTALPVLRAAPFEVEEMARLAIGELSDGPYVLRLTLIGRDGTELHEFTPISLDRSRPVLLSSADAEAQRPDLSGLWVAWESPRDPDGDGQSDLELFSGSFGSEGESPLLSAPGDQTDVVLSRWGAAWLDSIPGAAGTETALRVCPQPGQGAQCRPSTIAAVPHTGLGQPALSGRRLVFRQFVDGQNQLRSCELDRHGCDPQQIAAEVASATFPVIDARRIVFRSGVRELSSCLLDPRTGACSARPLETEGSFLEGLALSGSLLTYQALPSDFATLQLFACRIDPLSAACPALRIDSRPLSLDAPTFEADVSGDRVVWQARGAHGGVDVHYCEFESGECPVQRITNDAADQSRPAIDQHRVVWEDDRDGVRRIASFELPALRELRDRSVRPGQLLVIPLQSVDSGPPVRFSVRSPQLADVAGLGADLEQQGSGRALFRWRPTPHQSGSYSFVFRATRTGGLFTEESVRVQVGPRRAGPGPGAGRGRRTP